MPSFSPPTVNDVPRVLPDTRGPARLLMRHYEALPRGRTVLRIAGTYRTVDNPHGDDIAAATEVYLGGHVYEVTDAVATALQAAGYTVAGNPPSAWSAYAGVTWDSLADNTWGSL